MKIRPVGTELFHAERQTDMTELIVAFRNFTNAPNNSWSCTFTPYYGHAWCLIKHKDNFNLHIPFTVFVMYHALTKGECRLILSYSVRIFEYCSGPYSDFVASTLGVGPPLFLCYSQLCIPHY